MKKRNENATINMKRMGQVDEDDRATQDSIGHICFTP